MTDDYSAERSVTSYTGGDGGSLFSGNSTVRSPFIAGSTNPYVQRMQAEIIQIAHGHAQIAQELYKIIETLTLVEAQTVVNILTGLSQMHASIQNPDVKAGFEFYLKDQLTISLGHLRGITSGTISHLASLVARTLEPPPAPTPPPEQPKGIMRRLFG